MGDAQVRERELLRGRYRLQERLARGGMGTVWRASDELLGRTVAVKEVLLPPGLSDEERAAIRQRTLREARAAARLNHPGVVTVFDVIEEQDRPWIVMALLPSRTLAQVIREEGPLPAATVAAYGIALLDALDAAHDAGVLHRDVKPANVLVTRDGRIVLTDFGIATVEGDPTITTTGLLVGSPAYMAPERARGLPPGPASDLWSLGATLYAVADGRAPFERTNTFSTLTAVLTEAPPPSDRLGPLGPVIHGLLVKDPDDRLGATVARIMLTEAASAASTSAVPAVETSKGPASAIEPAFPVGPSSRETPPAPSHTPVTATTSPAASIDTSPASTAAPASSSDDPALAPAPLGSSEAPAVASPPSPPPPDPIDNVVAARRHPRRRIVLATLAGLLIVGALVVAGLSGLVSGLGDGTEGGSATPGTTPSADAATPQADAGAPTVADSVAPSAAASDGTADSSGPGSSGSGSSGSGSSGSGSSSGQSSGQSGGSGQGGSSGSNQAAAVPAGFTLHRDPTGFSIAVPQGWAPVRQGTLVDFQEPGGRRFLRIDQTDDPKPDPQQDWLDQEPSVANRLAGYERLSIERLDFRGWEASDWTFEWTASSGRLRVLNRGLTTGAYGYALYWSVPESQWDESRSIYNVAAATFTPAA